jgi:hypothetical protein
MNPTFNEANCIYLQGTTVIPWRWKIGTGNGSYKRENGREIAQIMKAEKKIRGIMMRIVSEEK